MLQTDRASYLVVDEPLLEFGESRHNGQIPQDPDPQVGLAEFGPYSSQLGGRWHPQRTVVVPVAADNDFLQVVTTLERMTRFIRIDEPGVSARLDFRGFEEVYRSELVVEKHIKGQVLSRSQFDDALKEHQPERGFKRLIELIGSAIDVVERERGGAVLALYLPRDIITQFRTLTPSFGSIKRKKRKAKSGDRDSQMMLFEEFMSEDEDEAEESLYQDLRRAIKVRAMQKGVAVQVLTDSFLTEDDSQPWAGKFWNLSCSLFCKAGGIPWRLPTNENIAHCGVRFGVTKDASGTQVLVGVAQVFSASGELVALRTGGASKGNRKSEAGYFLTEAQAYRLVSEVIDDYELVTGRIPDRLLVHKSSFFKEEEVQGIESAMRGIREIDMVYLKQKTPFRLMPPGGQPARRGTVVPTSEDSALVYLSGFIQQEGSWRGKHIPAPIEIVRCKSNRSLLDLAEELIRLTKMNWNTTIFSTREPCTFANASEMIGMMKELRSGEVLHPQIRYYI